MEIFERPFGPTGLETEWTVSDDTHLSHSGGMVDGGPVDQDVEHRMGSSGSSEFQVYVV